MPNESESTHLTHIQEALATLIAGLERGDAADEPLRLARRLQQQIQGTAAAIADDPQLVDALQRIDHTYRVSMARIDGLHDALDGIPHPHKPNPHEHPPSTGSRIGDSVRDSFLNMGG